MSSKTQQLIHFLEKELAVPTESIPLVLKQCEQKLDRLPVVLWQQNLIDLGQIDQLFAWLESYVSVV